MEDKNCGLSHILILIMYIQPQSAITKLFV